MSVQEALAELDLEALFDDAQRLRWDLRAGTIRGRTDDRSLFLSADIIRGIHQALQHEAGEAWGIILYACGKRWGARLWKQLDAELQTAQGTRPVDLDVDGFVAWIERYFAVHGWGRLELHLDDAVSHGIVRATLHNSLFSAVLEDLDEPVDHLVAGLLAAVFSAVADRDLGCIETASANKGAPAGVFLVSAAERIEALEEAVEEGRDAEAILEQLRAG
jgi:uncharacterized protein